MDDLCPTCINKEETLEHALFHCDGARAAWFSSHLGLLSPWHTQRGIVDWWFRCFESNHHNKRKATQDIKAWVLVLWWAFWRARNDIGLPINPHKVVSRARSMFGSPSDLPHRKGPFEIPCLFTQLKSSTEEVLIFSDAALAMDSGTSAFGFILLMNNSLVGCGCLKMTQDAHIQRGWNRGGTVCTKQGQRGGLF